MFFTPIRKRRYSVASPTVTWAESQAVTRVIASGWMTQGKEVERFEAKFAEYLEVEPWQVIACNNGTSALTVALMQQVPDRERVMMLPALTYGGTLNAVLAAGLTPWLVDVDADSWCMSTETLCAEIAKFGGLNGDFSNLGGILPVHLYGHLSNVTYGPSGTPLNRPVIEDACEALGASDMYGHAGKRGTSAVFSFFANKMLTTLGEGGVIVARDADAAARMRMIRGQGQCNTVRYDHVMPGINARMLEAQAAFGIEQLRRLPNEIAWRHDLLSEYEQFFEHAPEIVRMRNMNKVGVLSTPGPWLCAVRVPFDVRGTGFCGRLAERGVEARPMFVPLHCYAYAPQVIGRQAQHWNGEPFPASVEIARTGLALPLHPKLRKADVREIGARVLAEARYVIGDFENTRAIIPFPDEVAVDIAESQVKWHTR